VIVGLCRTHGAWCHVDGAFGLWAAIDPSRRHLLDYIPANDSDVPWGVESTPEFSRRTRAVALYAALRSLGRDGVRDLVERRCAHAQRIAARLAAHDGVCWAGGSRWHGGTVMRISVSGWQTTAADADRSADAILAALRAVLA